MRFRPWNHLSLPIRPERSPSPPAAVDKARQRAAQAAEARAPALPPVTTVRTAPEVVPPAPRIVPEAASPPAPSEPGPSPKTAEYTALAARAHTEPRPVANALYTLLSAHVKAATTLAEVREAALNCRIVMEALPDGPLRHNLADSLLPRLCERAMQLRPPRGAVGHIVAAALRACPGARDAVQQTVTEHALKAFQEACANADGAAVSRLIADLDRLGSALPPALAAPAQRRGATALYTALCALPEDGNDMRPQATRLHAWNSDLPLDFAGLRQAVWRLEQAAQLDDVTPFTTGQTIANLVESLAMRASAVPGAADGPHPVPALAPLAPRVGKALQQLHDGADRLGGIAHFAAQQLQRGLDALSLRFNLPPVKVEVSLPETDDDEQLANLLQFQLFAD